MNREERIILLLNKYLIDIFGYFNVYKEKNTFFIPIGSTALSVEVYKEDEDIYILMTSFVAFGLSPENELLRFLLTENTSLKAGAFGIVFENERMDIILTHTLRAKDINRELLKYVSLYLVERAEEYGKEIITVFGGQTFREYMLSEEKKRKGKLKIFHDTIEVGEKKMVVELFRIEEDRYVISGKVGEKEAFYIEKFGSLEEILNMESAIKKAITERNIKEICRLIKSYEREDSILFGELLGFKEEKIKKLKEIEEKFNILSNRLIKGEISRETYNKEIKKLEKEFEV